ncbi:MAG: DUF6428 family protein [Pirellulales bacterium]
MNIAELRALLDAHPTAGIRFQLPSGEMIPLHFHVTEVGRVDKRFIDCGGTRRAASSCLLQLWTADDTDHRLSAGKLARIMGLAEPILESPDLPVEAEYGPDVAAQYMVLDAIAAFGTLTFTLQGKHTDCLARENCGVDCAPQGGCC